MNVKRIVKRFVARNLRFERKAAPILIMALRRGGSTMLADAIAGVPGVWHVNEPFAVLPRHPGFRLKSARLPHAMHSQFFALDDAGRAQFAAYVDDLLEARLRGLGTCRRPRWPLRADRVCLKILNAPWMIDWFAEQPDVRIPVLLRHPAAQALSTLRQGWAFPVEAYLARLDAISNAFTPEQIALWRAVAAERDPWRTAILDWAVLSAPLRRSAAPCVRRFRYEDVVADPAAFVDDALCGWLGLSDRAGMLARLAVPSNSSSMSGEDARAAIAERDVAAITERWRSAVDARMARLGQEILDVFEVSEYSFGPLER